MLLLCCAESYNGFAQVSLLDLRFFRLKTVLSFSSSLIISHPSTCPVLSFYLVFFFYFSDTCAAAAANGHLEVLQAAHKHGCP